LELTSFLYAVSRDPTRLARSVAGTAERRGGVRSGPARTPPRERPSLACRPSFGTTRACPAR